MKKIITLIGIALLTFANVNAQSEPTKEETLDFIKIMIKKSAIGMYFESIDIEKSILVINDKYYKAYLNLENISQVTIRDSEDFESDVYVVFTKGNRVIWNDTGEDREFYEVFDFRTLEDCKKFKKALEHLKKLLDEENTGNSFFDDN